MYRLGWCMLLAIAIASTSGESKDATERTKTVPRNKLESFVENLEQLMLKLQEGIEDYQEKQHPPESSTASEVPLEVLRTAHATLLHEFQVIREEVLVQRNSNEKNQQQLVKTLELLANIQQEQQQRYTECQKAITDMRTKLLYDVPQKLSTLERDQKQIQNKLLAIEVGYRNCKDVPVKLSGKYKIRIKDEATSFEAYCEQKQTTGGWMVIQHRFDGTQNFNLKWNDYRDGFGELDSEHWLGLERIHQFTKEYVCELLVELMDFNGTYKYAFYDSFAIGSESEGYYLESLGNYRGTAGDSLRNHLGMRFSTSDYDNDSLSDENCAVICEAGWWFNKCGYAFLNGPQRNVEGPGKNKIAWYSFGEDWRGLRASRMMIRPKYKTK